MEASPAGRAHSDDSLVLIISRVVGSGALPLTSALALVREVGGARLRRELDTEAMWREYFVAHCHDRTVIVLPDTPASAPFSLRRLWSRHPPLGGLTFRDPAMRPPAPVVKWETSLLVVGPPCSGKTWLVHRLCTGSTPSRLDHPPLLGCNLRAAMLRLSDGKGSSVPGRLRIWEPAEQYRMDRLGGYLRSSKVVMLVVSAADAQAPQQARDYLAGLSAAMRRGTVLVVCCTQADLLQKRRAVEACPGGAPGVDADVLRRHCFAPPPRGASQQQLREVAREFGADFVSCSAVTGQGVEAAFAMALGACREFGGLTCSSSAFVLSHAAGTVSNSELLRALLHRR
mmetsp:Transcript_4452/g.12579  ORF Transcript_4452/g.12579 Transcript_4452/m.12579 type:complete len:343 (-) Transcript_4452:82-1110(-)